MHKSFEKENKVCGNETCEVFMNEIIMEGQLVKERFEDYPNLQMNSKAYVQAISSCGERDYKTNGIFIWYHILKNVLLDLLRVKQQQVHQLYYATTTTYHQGGHTACHP